MNATWTSLIPPLLVLILGFTTQRVLFSLIAGILSAALIAAHYNPIEGIMLACNYIWINTELSNLSSIDAFWKSKHLFIGFFLIILGILVALLSHCGGTYAYGSFIKKHIHSKRGAESSSLILSSLLFVDDYFSSLTVGSVMHPLTDLFKIPRVKLAFLIDAMAASLAILAPVSSWVPVLISQLEESGIGLDTTSTTFIHADPFYVYSGMVPFLFYSFLIIVGTWFIVRRGISYGSMHTHEHIADTTGNLFGGKEANSYIPDVHKRNKASASMIDFLVPISVLLATIFGLILYTGGWKVFGGNQTMLHAFQHARADLALFEGGLITLIFSFIFALLRKKIVVQEIFSFIHSGISVMAPALLILLFSWTLGDLLREHLHTGHYLASLLLGTLDVRLFPVMFFVTAALASFGTGSSWGTIALLFPIAIPMLVSFMKLQAPVDITAIPLIYPLLGAIASGAVFGDHISPISDTTIMASTSTGSHHIDHVKTQMNYALPMCIGSAFAFTISGYAISSWSFWTTVAASITTGIITSLIILELCHRYAIHKRKRQQ